MSQLVMFDKNPYNVIVCHNISKLSLCVTIFQNCHLVTDFLVNCSYLSTPCTVCMSLNAAWLVHFCGPSFLSVIVHRPCFSCHGACSSLGKTCLHGQPWQ